jgi:nucleoside-diphosphate-sugar epimerase
MQMIAILGASGFVGSALAQRLETTGERIVRLNRPGFDLTRPETLNRIPVDSEVIIHVAGSLGSAPDDRELWQTNVESMYYFTQYLNSCCRPRLVVYLSSGAVYGFRRERLTLSSPPRPGSLYGVSKFLGEQLIEAMLLAPWVTLRLFFPFGPGQRLLRLIPRLTRRILTNEPIELNTEQGSPIINPIFITDLVDQIISIMQNPEQRYYNLGGTVYLSIRGIAETIGDIVSREPQFIIGDRDVGNLMCEPDVSYVSPLTFEQQMQIAVRDIVGSLIVETS